jgi:hypothetical protein
LFVFLSNQKHKGKDREEGKDVKVSQQTIALKAELFSKNVSLTTHCSMTEGIQEHLENRNNIVCCFSKRKSKCC